MRLAQRFKPGPVQRMPTPGCSLAHHEQVPDAPRWWTVRPAQNLKPATSAARSVTSTLSALSEHVLVKPEGDDRRRRHAHTACVLSERKAGRLPLREEVEPPRPGVIARWRSRRRGGE